MPKTTYYAVTLAMSQPQEAVVYIRAANEEEAARIAMTDASPKARWRNVGEPFGLSVTEVIPAVAT